MSEKPASAPPYYEPEIRDLVKVLDALNHVMGEEPLDTLYIDSLETTLMHDGGDKVVFRIYWDHESDCFCVAPQAAE